MRNYQPGDDIRTIDWRVTARTGSAHTKLFREERERPVLVVVDQRSSMFFGSSHCFKSVLAAQLASLLAWSALDAGDRVGGLVFNEPGAPGDSPQAQSQNRAGAALPGDGLQPRPATAGRQHADSFADMLANLRRIARPAAAFS